MIKCKINKITPKMGTFNNHFLNSGFLQMKFPVVLEKSCNKMNLSNNFFSRYF